MEVSFHIDLEAVREELRLISVLGIIGFPGGSDGKESGICLQYRRPGFDPWVRNIPWRREWLPTPVVLPGEFHRQRRLIGYSPWGRTESDKIE